MSEIKRVLVTGAAGTVGGYIVKELLERGYHVVATDLTNELMAGWEKIWRRCASKSDGNYCTYNGDLSDEDFVKWLVGREPVDAVIHSAALVDVSLPREKLMAVNFKATKHLYKAFVAKNGKVFVFLSTGSAYKEAPLLKESTPFSPVSDYEESKVLAEEFLSCACIKDETRVLILRPSLIYGPCNQFLAANYLAIAIVLSEALGENMPWLFGGPKTNLVHGEDVARAAVFLMEKHEIWSPGYAEAFNVSDDSPMGFGDHLREMARACGYKPSRLPVLLPPARLIRIFRLAYNSSIFLGALNIILMHYWRGVKERNDLVCGFRPNLSRAMTPFFGQNTIFSNRKIKAIGFKLRFLDFRKGIEEVIPWYKKERWIP